MRREGGHQGEPFKLRLVSRCQRTNAHPGKCAGRSRSSDWTATAPHELPKQLRTDTTQSERLARAARWLLLRTKSERAGRDCPFSTGAGATQAPIRAVGRSHFRPEREPASRQRRRLQCRRATLSGCAAVRRRRGVLGARQKPPHLEEQLGGVLRVVASAGPPQPCPEGECKRCESELPACRGLRFCSVAGGRSSALGGDRGAERGRAAGV